MKKYILRLFRSLALFRDLFHNMNKLIIKNKIARIP